MSNVNLPMSTSSPPPPLLYSLSLPPSHSQRSIEPGGWFVKVQSAGIAGEEGRTLHLQRRDEARRLPIERRNAELHIVILNDVPDAEPLGTHGSESKHAEGRVATVARA
jgi:hypothetical protein